MCSKNGSITLSTLLATIPWAWGYDVGMEYLRVALVTLIIACPCALVISTPIAYVCGLAHAARVGILVKGGQHLETLGHIKVRKRCFRCAVHTIDRW